MILTKRRIEIFKCIVEEFIDTAEPVSSKTLVEKYRLPYSSATIRNDMSILEEYGFIEKPYTSSGRVPSTSGYRFYCENLLEKQLDDEAKNAITSIFKGRALSLEDAIKESCEIVSQMTNLTSGVLGPDASNLKLKHIKLFRIDDENAVCVLITDNGHAESRNFKFSSSVSIDDIEVCVDILNERLQGSYVNELYQKLEYIRPLLSSKVKRHEILFNAFAAAFIKFASDNVYFSNINNIMYQPEFSDIEKLKKIMMMMENQLIWKKVRDDNLQLSIVNDDGSKVVWFDDLAVITRKISINGYDEGELMVVGPSRMKYDKVVGLLNYIGNEIGKMYKK